jgi:hypothetical protein
MSLKTRAPRRRVLIPTVSRRHRRDGRDPEAAAAEQAARDGLKQLASDAIRAVVGQAIPDVTALGGIVLTSGRRGLINWLWGQALALGDCKHMRAFREAQCGQHVVIPMSCQTRVCPDCSRARAERIVRAVGAILEQVDGRRRSFMTLTVRNTADLRDGFRALDRAFAALRGRPIFRGGRCRMRTRAGKPFHPCASTSCTRWGRGRHRADRNCPDFRHRAVAGGARFDEVTFNLAARTWHPHAHLLLDAPYIDQHELADAWRAITCTDPHHRRAGWCPSECTAGSSVVDVRRVDPRTVREAVKYPTKVALLIAGDDPTQLVEFLVATRGRRMMRGFGSFYGVELLNEELPEPETVVKRVASGEHDHAGRPIFRRYTLPRFCPHCDRDTLTIDLDERKGCTYEDPFVVPRAHLRLRSGVLAWRPPP